MPPVKWISFHSLPSRSEWRLVYPHSSIGFQGQIYNIALEVSDDPAKILSVSRYGSGLTPVDKEGIVNAASCPAADRSTSLCRGINHQIITYSTYKKKCQSYRIKSR